jgi:ribosomal peptide maturation radical SAM protein 1
MPMAAASRPSIQLGLLAAIGSRAGHVVETLHANLDFARMIIDLTPGSDGDELTRAVLAERDPYSRLADLRVLVGDWLFSPEAFGQDAPDPIGLYVTDGLDHSAAGLAGTAMGPDQLLALRDQAVPVWLDSMLGAVAWSDYDVVGFTSTFQQHVASLAMARRIKVAHPSVLTLFGGANMDAGMGVAWMRSAPWIDLALRGEADRSFVRLLDGLRDGDDLAPIAGIVGRNDDGIVVTGAEPEAVEDLDESPVPDYREFFARAADLGLVPAHAAHLVDVPFEAARGCWWGQKRHCTFCGLNGSTMTFRSKSAKRVIDELDTLAVRHGTFTMSAVDNIVDTRYLGEVFPSLAASETTFDLFWEVKADLSRADIATLRAGGVRRMQPGIESLSSRVLGLMRKGTRAAWNVNVLRWAQHYGITVVWNLLWGFPGEAPGDYDEQASLVPRLMHLQPPSGMAQIWLERFSPLFTESPDLGIDSRRPIDAYQHVYPSWVDLDDAAYYFAYDSDAVPGPDAVAGLQRRVEAWQAAWDPSPPESTRVGSPAWALGGETGPVPRRRPSLVRHRAPSFVQIIDDRDPGPTVVHRLDGVGARLHEACMELPRTAGSLADELGAPVEPVVRAMDGLVERGLVMRDRALYLSLALPVRR